MAIFVAVMVAYQLMHVESKLALTTPGPPTAEPSSSSGEQRESPHRFPLCSGRQLQCHRLSNAASSTEVTSSALLILVPLHVAADVSMLLVVQIIFSMQSDPPTLPLCWHPT